MMAMFGELRAREIRAGAEGDAGEFIEAAGVGKCPIREVQEMLDARAAEGTNDGGTGNGDEPGLDS
jgi:hypothetical protein